jgi:phosphatidylserine decarboxylase
MVIRDAKDNTIMVRQIAGALARRIKWYVSKGAPLEQGEEFGFIKFGSRVDMYLPLDAEILCEMDQVTKGARTPIARLKE